MNEFESLVFEMRTAQKNHHEFGSLYWLKQKQIFEQKVDEYIMGKNETTNNHRN